MARKLIQLILLASILMVFTANAWEEPAFCRDPIQALLNNFCNLQRAKNPRWRPSPCNGWPCSVKKEQWYKDLQRKRGKRAAKGAKKELGGYPCYQKITLVDRNNPKISFNAWKKIQGCSVARAYGQPTTRY